MCEMQKPSALQIRTMTCDDVDLALAWAAREGWNPGIADAECFHAVDPAGFLLGCLDGEPIGCISVVAYGLTFGFVGLYMVKPELRGRGYGHHLWQIGMARLKTRIVGLDGVIAQQENYKRSGQCSPTEIYVSVESPIVNALQTRDSRRSVLDLKKTSSLMIASSSPLRVIISYNAGSGPNNAKRWL